MWRKKVFQRGDEAAANGQDNITDSATHRYGVLVISRTPQTFHPFVPLTSQPHLSEISGLATRIGRGHCRLVSRNRWTAEKALRPRTGSVRGTVWWLKENDSCREQDQGTGHYRPAFHALGVRQRLEQAFDMDQADDRRGDSRAGARGWLRMHAGIKPSIPPPRHFVPWQSGETGHLKEGAPTGWGVRSPGGAEGRLPCHGGGWDRRKVEVF